MGDSTDPWRELEEQLAELNELAEKRLEEPRNPAPDGLPPVGSWIRAVEIDDDGHPRSLTPWHYVAGWDSRWGHLYTRCRRTGTNHRLVAALERYLGELPAWPYHRSRARLLVAPGAPAEACRQCERRLEQDAAKVAAVELERIREGRLALIPELEAVAGDSSIDDAERGRRLRELWLGSR